MNWWMAAAGFIAVFAGVILVSVFLFLVFLSMYVGHEIAGDIGMVAGLLIFIAAVTGALVGYLTRD